MITVVLMQVDLMCSITLSQLVHKGESGVCSRKDGSGNSWIHLGDSGGSNLQDAATPLAKIQ